MTGSPSPVSSRSPRRSCSPGDGARRGYRRRSLLRALRVGLRLLLRLVPLLLLLATWSTSTATGVRASSSLISTTPEPPPSYEPSFTGWTPCQPETGGLTRTEWAACSTAYTADKSRQFTTISLFLIVALLTATFLLVAFR